MKSMLTILLYHLSVIYFLSNKTDRKKDIPSTKKVRGRKSKATQAKVTLMKIKMKAVGDRSIPDTEKFFLQVALPTCHTERKSPYFFSKVSYLLMIC